MSLGNRKKEYVADWDVETFDTSPPEDVNERFSATADSLNDLDPLDMLEDPASGREMFTSNVKTPSKFGYVNEAHKLYIGKEFTPEQFADWWSVQSFGTLPYNGVGIHHTAIPDRNSWIGLQHLHNTFDYFNRQLGWPRGVGPHLWLRSKRSGKVAGPKIYVGTHPAHDGIGISYRNRRYLHIEFIDRFTYYDMDGNDIWLYAFVLDIVCGQRKVPLNHCPSPGYDNPSTPMKGWLFHRNARTDIKDCPGGKVTEGSFTNRVNNVLDDTPEFVPSPPAQEPTEGKFNVPAFTVVTTAAGEDLAKKFVDAGRSVGLGETRLQWTGRSDKTKYASYTGYNSPAENKKRTLVFHLEAIKSLDSRVKDQGLLDKPITQTGHWNCLSDDKVRVAAKEMCRLEGKDYHRFMQNFGESSPDPTPVKPVPVKVRAFNEISGNPRHSLESVLKLLDGRRANADSKAMVREIYKQRSKFPANAPAPDFLAIQFLHETGFATWGGGAKKWNPAGIKLANASGDTLRDFETPTTAAAGAHMLYNHWGSLLGYAPVNPVHGRFSVAKSVYQSKGVYGRIKTVDQLGNGIWAVDPHYANKLKKYLNELEGL